MKKSIIIIVLPVLFFSSMKLSAQNFPKELAGNWRGEFVIRDTVKVPFNFQISDNGEVVLLNAEEKFKTGTASAKGDSLHIPLDAFDNELAFRVNGEKLTGILKKQAGNKLADVTAEKGILYRFKDDGEKPSPIGGTYEVNFRQQNGREDRGVAILKQNRNKLTGTFLRSSGDSRYLEGIVKGHQFYLSSFIGSSPGYYQGTVTADGKLKGVQTGVRATTMIEGHLNEQAQLPDAYSLAKASDATFEFSLPDATGKIISRTDDAFRDKVLIVAITGTWCPNCIDEAEFLSQWYEKNKSRGVEVISVHFEAASDTAFYRKAMDRFKKRFNITYYQLFGGIPDKDSIMKALPGLTDFHAYPTTLFVDKKGRVSKVHTGYSGPATGKYYDAFKKEFNDEVDRLLKKKEG